MSLEFSSNRVRTAAVAFLTLALSGCFGGIVQDGVTGDSMNGVMVRVWMCPTCPWEQTMTTNISGFTGAYAFDPYEGGPYIFPDGTESVRIRVSRPGYITRWIYHRVLYDQTYEGKKFDTRNVDLFPVSTIPYYNIDWDQDGLSTSEELAIGTHPHLADTDGDAILDGWEVYGNNWVDYPALGANPLKKDIFVECDYMPGRLPHVDAIPAVIQAFADAPVENPDGSTGIDLHVEFDEEIPFESPVSGERFGELKAQYFNPKRQSGFRYCVFGDDSQPGPGESFDSFAPDALDIFISMTDDRGVPKSRLATSLAFMHELGHTLHLGHGGVDGINDKPNYLSVMNYSFAGTGLTRDGETGILDYSRAELSSLDENALDESQGLTVLDGPQSMLDGFETRAWVDDFQLGLYTISTWVTFINLSDPIDWNRDDSFDTGVVADLNNDGVEGQVLRGHNDWANLDFSSGGRIGGQ